MARRHVILSFILSIAAFLIAAFGGAYLSEVAQNQIIAILASIIVAASALLAIALFSVIFVSIMSTIMLMCVTAETIQKKSGNPLYYLQWSEVRAKFDALKKVRENS
jgi:hypothetical protein